MLARAGVTLEVIPVRGQIVLLEPSAVRLTRVIERDKRYLVPRRDGHILIGSTEELTGFEKANTDEGVSGLLEFAYDICPALRDARIEQCWSGLRPSRRGADGPQARRSARSVAREAPSEIRR